MKTITAAARLMALVTFVSLAWVARAATVYLNPGSCAQGNEVWYAYTWTEDVVVTDEDGNETTIPGAKTWTASASSEDGVFKFNIDDAAGYDLIFVRMNPGGTDVPSWDAAWNQTDDLTLINGATYQLTGWRDGTNRMEGKWVLPESNTDKPVWQQTDPAGANYIKNRRALTGRHCMVNKMINVVEAGSWIKGLDNLVNEDISDVAVFPSIASVGVGAKPITAVRDTKNHYAAGTTAGFNMVASTGASVLKLAAANAWAISFYLEGKLMATKAVSSGQNIGGVGLSLIKIPGSDEVSLDVSATAPCEFDEISLMPTGLADASVVTNTRLKYAFVGDYEINTITYTSMKNYAASHGRKEFSLDQGTKQIYRTKDGYYDTRALNESGHWVGSDLINDDLKDGVAWGVLSVGANLDCRVGAAINPTDLDQSQPFKKGSTVGFKAAAASLLKLPVGTWAKIRLYKGEWQEFDDPLLTRKCDKQYVQTEVQEETIDANVLGLSIISGGEQFPTITAKEDFSHMRVTFYTVLSLDVGGMKGFYGFVSDPAESTHQCNLLLNVNTSICDSEDQYQLSANGGIPVTWSVDSQPEGANAQVNEQGLATGMTVDGAYSFKATAEDGCCDYVTITRGLYASSATCDEPVTNKDGDNYELSTINDGGSLIVINDQLQDASNVLNASLEDYAIYKSVLNGTVVENLPIVGVKKKNGNFSDGTHARRIGFLVEAQSTGLGLDAIDLFNIRTYKNGVQTSSKVISETNAVKVKLIGSNKSQKMRFAVTVPADVEFNEFVLWKSGVLDLSIDRFKIYYAFDEAISDVDAENECIDPLGCDATVISNTTNARINGNEMQFAGGVQVGTVVDNLTFLVDDDINTGVSISNTLSLGDGMVIAVDLGHVYSKHQQVGMIMDSKTYLAGVKAGSWVTIKTFLNGVEQERQSDWNVLGVNAIGYGDKSYIFMNPTKDYDEIRITIASVANLLNFDSKYYGIFIRNDYDGDGTPDCHDDDSCVDEYTLDEEATELHKTRDYPLGNLVLHRSFYNDWDCIVLPVDLNWLQVRNAFGNDVLIAKPEGWYLWENTSNLDNSKRQARTVLYYNPLTDKDDDIAMRKGEYYIIKTFRKADLEEGTYTAADGITLNAPIYFIPGVTYTRDIESSVSTTKQLVQKAAPGSGAQQAPALRAEDAQNVTLHGSLIHLDGSVNDKVAQGNYKYDAGNSLKQLPIDEAMLGFRFYAENNTDNALVNDIDDEGKPTGVVNILWNPLATKQGVYSLDGRQLRFNNDILGLPAGIYIVGGKKVIITK